MNKHEEHQKKGIVYQATCEECQRQQLGPLAFSNIHATYNHAFVLATTKEGRTFQTICRKQPKRKNCE
jgi:hypothetical protein